MIDGVAHHSGFTRHGHSKHLDVHLFSVIVVIVVSSATTLLPGGAHPAQ